MASRVAIIGTVGLPAKYGGFETLTEQLVSRLGSRVSFTVYCSASSYSERPPKYRNAELVYLPLKANGWQSILYDGASALHAIRKADVLLFLGVSGAAFIPLIRLFFRGRVLCHIDGLEWRRQKWGRMERWFLKASERIGVLTSDIVIADNVVIKEHVASTYGKDAILIEYGSDHALRVPAETLQSQGFPFAAGRYAFTVCRIEPENSITMILESFEESGREFVIVGNWNHSEYSRRLKMRYEGKARIHILDPIFDPVKLGVLRSNCSVYIHGHSAGGTNPSLVEAMSLGLPTVALDVAYNIATTEGLALYFRDASGLSALLSQASESQLRQVGTNLRMLAEKRYTWDRICGLYHSLLTAE